MNDKFKELKEKQDEMMKKYGYVIHNVFPTSDDEGMCSHHTHGLKESFNHMDLEILLPLNPSIVNSVIRGMVEQIKEGETFEDKLISNKVIQNYDVQLVKVNADNRELLRIVLPDVNGKFPSDKDCADVYKNQLDDVMKNSLNKKN